MRANVTVGSVELDLLSNGATAIIYKNAFHIDLLKALATMKEEDAGSDHTFEIITRLAYVMNMQATKPFKELMNSLTDEAFIEWLWQFETDDFQNAEVILNIMSLWNRNIKGTSTAKNA